MKPRLLQIAGSLLLLASMTFAVARLEAADAWVSLWLPFVVAGVALVVLGTILPQQPDPQPADRTTLSVRWRRR